MPKKKKNHFLSCNVLSGKRLHYTIPQFFTLKSTICFSNSCKHLPSICVVCVCNCLLMEAGNSEMFPDQMEYCSFASLPLSVFFFSHPLHLQASTNLFSLSYCAQLPFLPKHANKIAKFRCSECKCRHIDTI